MGPRWGSFRGAPQPTATKARQVGADQRSGPVRRPRMCAVMGISGAASDNPHRGAVRPRWSDRPGRCRSRARGRRVLLDGLGRRDLRGMGARGQRRPRDSRRLAAHARARPPVRERQTGPGGGTRLDPLLRRDAAGRARDLQGLPDEESGRHHRSHRRPGRRLLQLPPCLSRQSGRHARRSVQQGRTVRAPVTAALTADCVGSGLGRQRQPTV